MDRLNAFVLIIGIFMLLVYSNITNAAVVRAPYENDFQEETADFTFAPAGKWFHIPDEGVYSNEFRKATTMAGLTVENLGGNPSFAKPFTVVTDFILNAGNGTSSYVGVSFLCEGENLADSKGYNFRQVMATPNDTKIALHIRRNGVIVASGGCFTQLRYEYGTNLRYIINCVYVDTDNDGVNDALDITATVMNPATGGTSFLTYRDQEPLTWNAFGVKTYDANNVPSSFLLDSFSISNDSPTLTTLIIR
jgi:hypothetical protein